MKVITEKELKYLFNEDSFTILRNYLEEQETFIKTIIQTNYYLDTPERYLKRAGVSARIREFEDSSCELTFKRKIKTLNHEFMKEEITIPLTKEEFLTIKNHGISQLAKALDILPNFCEASDVRRISITGKLRTYRSLFKVDGITEFLELDVNEFLNTKDYEVEWEAEQLEKPKAKLESIFELLKINPLNLKMSKSDRYKLVEDSIISN